MQRFFSVLAMLWLYLNPLYSQVLDVGDTLPPAPFSFVQPGRLTILDFMATTCSGCVEALGHMDSLQQAFKGRADIIPVTAEDSARVSRFLVSNHIGRRVHLPFRVGDTVLSGFFPHNSISHVVWIGPDRVVKAITYAQYVNYHNILDLLNRRAVAWPVKRDGADEGADTTRYYTGFRHFQPGQPVSTAIDSAGGRVSINFINLRVLDMLRQVFGCLDLPPSQVRLQVRDPSRLVYDPARDYLDQFDVRNRYCYTAFLPPVGWREKVLADLGFYLRVKATYRLQPVRVTLSAAGDNTLYDLNNRYGGRPVVFNKAGKGTAVRPMMILTVQDF